MKALIRASYTGLMAKKIYWMPPLILCLTLFVLLLLLTNKASIHAPFLYTTF
jgi:hypothetical protein